MDPDLYFIDYVKCCSERNLCDRLNIMEIWRYKLNIPYFDLRLVVKSHGWINLPPFNWDDEYGILSRGDKLGKLPICITVKQTEEDVQIQIKASRFLDSAECEIVKKRIIYMLGADVDMSGFLKKAKSLNKDVHLLALRGGGRFLRGTTLFEDVSKTLMTTNASWRFTTRMCEGLVSRFCGDNVGKNCRYFPSAFDIKALKLSDLKRNFSLGYRAEYLKGIADAFCANNNYEGWDYEQIIDNLQTMKGLGVYSVDHISVLLGFYNRIPTDSEVLRYVADIGIKPVRNDIARHFNPWHPYEFLAYKIERRVLKTNWIGD